MRRLAEDLNRSLDGLKAGNTKRPVLSQTLVDMFRDAWIIDSINFNAHAIRSGFTVLALLESHTLSRQIGESVPQLSKISINLLQEDFERVLDGSIETASPRSVQHAPAIPARSEAPRVFINYRRDDTTSEANSLFYRLLSESIKVFRDKETLKLGMKFEQMIEATVGECNVLLALIGKNWLAAADDEGRRRLDNERDWVRIEIAEALRQGKTVIPCLVNGARMPRRQELPPDLQELGAINCLEITLENFSRDTERLLEVLRRERPYQIRE